MIIQLEGQVRKAKDLGNLQARIGTSGVPEEYLRKIRELEEQLDNKIYVMSGLERDLKSTRQDLGRLK